VNLKPLSWNDIIVEKSVFFLFSLFFFLDYLSLALGFIPRQLTWLPEFISLGILFYIFIKLLREKELIPIISKTQLVIFFVVFTVIGLVINQVEIPVALAGIRNDFKFLPLFFLPFFYRFDKNFMRKFLVFLFILALLQFPVALIQRIVYKTTSGDPIGGSLGAHSSGILSVFLTLCLVFWSFHYMKSRLKTPVYVLGFIILIMPMGLNETKISFFILPVSFVCIVVFTQNKKKYIKTLLVVFACFAVGILIIGSLFNQFYVQDERADKKVLSQKTDSSLITDSPSKPEAEVTEKPEIKEKKPSRFKIKEFFKPERFMTNVYYRKTRMSGALNRLPQVIFAFNYIKKNPVLFLLGVGAGNASDSFFEKARGEYYKKFGDLDIGNNLLSRMLWEYGMIGTLLFFSIFVFFFIKARGLRKSDDIIGVTASGYLVLIVVFFITSIYFNTMLINLFGYLFWFLGGFMLAYGYHLKALKETNK